MGSAKSISQPMIAAIILITMGALLMGVYFLGNDLKSKI